MKHSHEKFIAGLDIGSTKVRLVVGQVIESQEDNQSELQILGAVDVLSEGVHKGKINSIEDLVSCISACLEKAERVVGSPINDVWLGISGLHVMSQTSKGVVAVAKANSEITEEDVNRAIDAARSIATPLNYEILHVLPRSFIVDGQQAIKDPVGMTGIRLEVDANIILVASAQNKNLLKAVFRTGLEIEDVVLSILATAEAVLTKKQKELGVAVVDIGGSTTSIVAYEEGEVLFTSVLPLGAESITNDIAIGLRTSVEVAERIKVEYGNCFFTNDKKVEIDLFELGALEHDIIKLKYLTEIISARVEEILQKVDGELRKAQRSGLLPAGVLFTGGGAQLPGLVEMSKKVVRLPSSLGYPLDIMSVTNKVNDLSYTTAIGLVKWGRLMQSVGSGGNNFFRKLGSIGKAMGKLKGWVKMLIP